MYFEVKSTDVHHVHLRPDAWITTDNKQKHMITTAIEDQWLKEKNA